VPPRTSPVGRVDPEGLRSCDRHCLGIGPAAAGIGKNSLGKRVYISGNAAVREISSCLCGSIAAVFVLVPLLWSVYETSFYRKALPESLATSGLAQTGASVGFGEACGGVIFQLDDTTRNEINRKGLPFFDDARQGRGYLPGSRLQSFYNYEPWQETPVPQKWISGSWVGLSCMTLPQELSRAIVEAAKQPGSYFRTKREAELLVIPSLGLIVFTYFG
jgi:hypothetical protein